MQQCVRGRTISPPKMLGKAKECFVDPIQLFKGVFLIMKSRLRDVDTSKILTLFLNTIKAFARLSNAIVP